MCVQRALPCVSYHRLRDRTRAACTRATDSDSVSEAMCTGYGCSSMTTGYYHSHACVHCCCFQVIIYTELVIATVYISVSIASMSAYVN